MIDRSAGRGQQLRNVTVAEVERAAEVLGVDPFLLLARLAPREVDELDIGHAERLGELIHCR